MMARSWLVLAAVLLAGCQQSLPPDPSRDNGQNFGEKFFNIICQRLAYTSSNQAYLKSVQQHKTSLAAHAADPSVPVVPLRPRDVSGSLYRSACRYGPTFLPSSAKVADPKVYTLVQGRARMVKALNMIFPAGELSALQDYLIKILPLTDNGRFPDVVNRAVDLFKNELEKDTKLHWSLARLDHRIAYRPRSVALGVIRELLHYETLHPDLKTLVGFVGEKGKGHKALMDLVAALSFELRHAEAAGGAQGDPQRTLNLALGLLFSEDQRFSSGASPMWLVRRDWRGVARVAQSGGVLPIPFVDKDKDGLADIDSLGQYLTENKKKIPVPFLYDRKTVDTAAGRDSAGRALDTKGKPVYDYVNLDRTLLGGLSREALDILDYDKDIAVQLALGASLMLGQQKAMTKTVSKETLAYQGHDPNSSPVVDLAHGALQALRAPTIDATLEGVSLLFNKHGATTARLVDAMLTAKDMGKKFPKAAIIDGSTLWDDTVVVLQKVAATPGLMEDLVKALGDPKTTNLGPMIANYLKYKDIHTLDKQGLLVVGSDGKAPGFKVPVDRSKADRRETNGQDNRSIQQRLSHIINNTNRMKMCNKANACIGLKILGQDLCFYRFKECELLEVKNAALVYTQSIARLRDKDGKLTSTPKAQLTLALPSAIQKILDAAGIKNDFILETITGIKGFTTRPTTEAINRLLFMASYPQTLAMLQDPIKDIDGHKVADYHKGSLLSWEVKHTNLNHSYPVVFFDAIRPVVQAFADHNAEQLFLDMVSLFHRHWASKKSAPFHQFTNPLGKDGVYGSAIVNWEAFLAEVLTKTDLMAALSAASPVLRNLTLKSGKKALPELVKAIAYAIDPAASSGALSHRARTCRSDGDCDCSGVRRCVSGKCTNLHIACKSDGKTAVSCGSGSNRCVTPFYLLADAFAAKRATLKQAEARGDSALVNAWNDSTSELVDIFLEVTGKGTTARFKNGRIVPTAVALVRFVRGRIATHRAKGDLATWLGKELVDDVARILSSPLMARAVAFFKVVEGNAKVKKVIYDLGDHLINEAKSSPAFRAVLTGLADLAQILVDDLNLVPVAQAAGHAASAKVGLVKALLRFLEPGLAADNDKSPILVKILRNTWKELEPGHAPVQTLLDLATEVHRLRPGTGATYVGQDFKSAFYESRDFLENGETGLNKFFEIVKNRCGVPPCK